MKRLSYGDISTSARLLLQQVAATFQATLMISLDLVTVVAIYTQRTEDAAVLMTEVVATSTRDHAARASLCDGPDHLLGFSSYLTFLWVAHR
jgi:hypothetical protein